MYNNDNNQSVFVFGHYGKRLELLDKDRFKLLAQTNPHISLSRLYNKNMIVLTKNIEYAITKNDINMIDLMIDLIEHENYLDNIFREANKLMLGLGDSVSFGSLIAGQLKSSVKHGKIASRPVDKVMIK